MPQLTPLILLGITLTSGGIALTLWRASSDLLRSNHSAPKASVVLWGAPWLLVGFLFWGYWNRVWLDAWSGELSFAHGFWASFWFLGSPILVGFLAGLPFRNRKRLLWLMRAGLINSRVTSPWEDHVACWRDGIWVYFEEGGRSYRGSAFSRAADASQVLLSELAVETDGDWGGLDGALRVCLFPQTGVAFWYEPDSAKPET